MIYKSFTFMRMRYEVRDWTRDGVVCRYRAHNTGSHFFIFFTYPDLKTMGFNKICERCKGTGERQDFSCDAGDCTSCEGTGGIEIE